MKVPPLVVIVGVTASGKSALAMEVARKYKGEIICADSRTVYKGIDIGTAKPTKVERSEIKHHLLDLVSPDQIFTAAEFKRLAMAAINDIYSRGKLPILVGGTGLYIDGVVFDFAFLPPADNEEREQLDLMTVEQLQQIIRDRELELPLNSKNPRHLMRTIETNGAIPVKKGLRDDTLIIGIDVDKEVVKKRISDRVNTMVDHGLVDETKALEEKYKDGAPGLLTTGHKAFGSYIHGEISLEEAKKQFARNDYQLARRQRAWFKRNPHIHWIKNSSEALGLINKFLQNNN